MSELSHQQCLLLYCRICGKRNQANNPSRCLNPVSNFAHYLKTLHDLDVQSENAETYPKFACDSCAFKYENESFVTKYNFALANLASDPEGVVKLGRELPDVADFWAHSSIACQICHDINYPDNAGSPALVEAYLLVSQFPQKSLQAALEPSRIAIKPDQVVKPIEISEQQHQRQLTVEETEFQAKVENAIWKQMLTLQSKSCRFRVIMILEILKTLNPACYGKVIGGLEAYGIAVGEGSSYDDASIVMQDLLIIVPSLINLPLTKFIVLIGRLVAKDALNSAYVDMYNQLGVQIQTENPSMKAMMEGNEPQPLLIAFETNPSYEDTGSPSKINLIVTEEAKEMITIDFEAYQKIFEALPGGPRRLSNEQLDAKKKLFHLSLPMSRILRTDIVFHLMNSAKQAKRELLKRVGIEFKNVGSLLCPSLSSQSMASFFERQLSQLVDVQWAVIMAEVIFKLAHSKDTLSLEHIGITIDPTHRKVPTWMRVRNAVSNFLIDGPGDPILDFPTYLVTKLNLKLTSPHIRAVEAALCCPEDKAKAIITEGLEKATAIKPNEQPKVQKLKLIPLSKTVSSIPKVEQLSSSPSKKRKVESRRLKLKFVRRATGKDKTKDMSPLSKLDPNVIKVETHRKNTRPKRSSPSKAVKKKNETFVGDTNRQCSVVLDRINVDPDDIVFVDMSGPPPTIKQEPICFDGEVTEEPVIIPTITK